MLEAADQAAYAAAVSRIGADVADFAGEAVAAAQDAAVEHDARGDARADAQIRQVSGLLVLELDPRRGRTRVVLDVARQADLLAEHRPKGKLARVTAAAEVHGEADRAALRL